MGAEISGKVSSVGLPARTMVSLKSAVQRCLVRNVRYLGRQYLHLSGYIWRHLPAQVTSHRVVLIYGAHLHWLSQRLEARTQYTGTYFFRNRCELELLRRILAPIQHGFTLAITILGCSKGAEVYSYLYSIRSERPDLTVELRAVDIDSAVLEFAKEGCYSLIKVSPQKGSNSIPLSVDERLTLRTFGDQCTSVFERMSADEIDVLFERHGVHARVKPQFRAGIKWQPGDAGDVKLVQQLGLQDIVVANRFLCHMRPEQSEVCLRNLARLVKPGGYLFVSGVDLAVRSKVAQDLGWTPVTELIEEIHDGDPSLRRDWPLQYWGLEPFDRRRSDRNIRYASVFRMGVESPEIEPAKRIGANQAQTCVNTYE